MKYFNLGPRASTIRTQPAGACHNCHAPVSEKFCGQCGQAAHLHVASAHEFIHHFIGHYVAAEGKLWRTLLALLFRPGQLTLEFVRGRRGQFIDPLRLLLTISLLAFLLLKLMPVLDSSPAPEPTPAAASRAPMPSHTETSGALNKWAISTYKRLSPSFAVNFDKFMKLPGTQQTEVFMNAWLSKGPTLALLMIPVVAFWLKLAHLGTGWRYGEHLVFAFHLLAFALSLVSLGVLLAVLLEITRIWHVALAAVPLYMLLAIRKVYGGNWGLTLLRWIAVGYASLMSFKGMLWIAFSMTIAAGIT
ncbi:DUF3667 domain-containing protein [Massilia sp. SR12]